MPDRVFVPPPGMAPLRRLLRKNAFAPLLAKARGLFGDGWAIDIVETLPDAKDFQDWRFEPLRLDGEQVGFVVFLPPPGLSSQVWLHPHLPDLSRFIADCIESQLAGEILRRSLATEALTKYREIALLHRATLGLNGSLRPRDVALALLNECRQGGLPASVGMVFLLPPGRETFQPACSCGDAAGCRLAEVAGSTLFWDITKTQKGEIINDLGADRRWRDEAALAALILSPLVAANRVVGMLALGSSERVRFEASHLQYVGTLATVAGIAMGNALHFESVQALINSLMQALATAIDARDPFTSGHSQRVARLGVALAKVVHEDTTHFADVAFSPSDLEELLYAGLLHDVGKIGIREEVLTKATRLSAGAMAVIGQRLELAGLLAGQDNQEDFEKLCRLNAADSVSREDAAFIMRLGAGEIPINGRSMPILTEEELAHLLIARGNLTPEERREIERHPVESHRILQHIPFPENMGRLLTIISQHHERLDGSGYPYGLEDGDILLQSRMIAIVDVYDAITKARHYKPALPREKALAILWQEARAGRLDARLVELLEAHIDAVERDCERLAQRMDFSEYLGQHDAMATAASC